ncbi:hypothetical protein LDENG_00119990 [Lucifuga dentata]|nr:hypothetical protein LDENG_00119990 [Lucifuga dentata]
MWLGSDTSYRLKHRVSLRVVWLCGFDDEPEEEEGAGDMDLRVTLILAWALTFCLVSFCSPEVKERWLDTLHRKIKDAKVRAGCTSSPPDDLMKVLSGNVMTKTLTEGGMEPFIEFPLDGDAKISAPSKPSDNPEEKVMQPIGNNGTKWNLVRRLRKGSGLANKLSRLDIESKTRLFGRPLCKICPDDRSLPKPIAEMLVLLWKKGPSTEGVFRKPCNSKNMKDIREQLNGGLEVDLEGLPVVLLVGLLKSFLKELPGSLLVTELYDDWMKALDTEDTQQRVLEMKKVIDKLPAPNRLLLQHLMSVLHHILESAEVNKMDASNLAVCIAPTLLQLDSTPLEEQHDKLKKVTKLTQLLIEHCEILGENIQNLLDVDEDNSDSLSSHQHDSAYDSTDPDADGDPGECTGSTRGEDGSSSSLLYASTANPCWPSDALFHTFTKPAFNRRCSEPIILQSADICSLRGLARSHDDCSLERRDFEEQPLKKQISDDSFLLRRREGARSALSFPKLTRSSNVEAVHAAGYRVKDCSCSSLESAASNQSEGSVFTSSPLGSPACPRRTNSTNQPRKGANVQQDSGKTSSAEKRRSKSMKVGGKVPVRTRSLGAFSLTRGSLKKAESQKETPFPCETLQEDFQNEAELPAEVLQKPRPLSAIEVFKQVDSRLPCRPPSYEKAVEDVGLPPPYGSMTVQDAKVLERRSRPSSVNYDFASTCTVSQYTDFFAQAAQDEAGVVERRHPFRQRAMSESVSSTHHDALLRRCSQPVFEEFSYAKESYI